MMFVVERITIEPAARLLVQYSYHLCDCVLLLFYRSVEIARDKVMSCMCVVVVCELNSF